MSGRDLKKNSNTQWKIEKGPTKIVKEKKKIQSKTSRKPRPVYVLQT